MGVKGVGVGGRRGNGEEWREVGKKSGVLRGVTSWKRREGGRGGIG